MAYRVRRCRSSEELGQALAAIGHYFGWVPQLEEVERFARLLPAERTHAVFDDGSIVAGAGAFTFDLTVPGPVAIACAGVTVVGTLPTHRRRGLLTRMMRAQLDDIHRREEPIAALYASEETIYGRYGYGLASLRQEVRLPRTWAALRADAPSSSGATRLVERDEAARAFPRVYERMRRTTPGFLSRSRDWWELRRLWDDPDRRPAGGGPHNYALLELDGRASAYALYRLVQREENGQWKRRLHVIEALGVDVTGTREIWRFLFGIDWVDEILAWYLPTDHPLMHMVARLDRLDLGVETGLWIRLVDVGAALSARGYSEDGRVTFEVTDAFGPWNADTWTLEGGIARRSRRRPDLRLDITSLGATYLGGFSFAQLSRAGLVEETRRGAAVRADAMFATDRAPWCPENF
jgi:predicted acetyltransferase